MTSQVQVFNQALNLIGQSEKVQSPTENSTVAQNCLLWYDQARRLVLSAHPWYCATRVARLALDKQRDWDVAWVNTDPPEPWLYSYGLPSDCLRPQFVGTKEGFTLGSMPSGKQVMFTNTYQPILTYTFDETRPEVWDPDLNQAITATLAAMISQGITGQSALTQKLVNQVGAIIHSAALAQANTENNDWYATPAGLIERGSVFNEQPMQYVYPSANFVVAGVTYAS